MSLSCQYEQVRVANHLGDIVRQISVEARLKVPERYPKLARIKGGEFRAEAPVLSINEGLLIVSGRLNPHLIYLADPPLSEGSGENAEEFYAPVEYGISWTDEAGVGYEERIEIPGLAIDMLVEVDLKPSTALFEKDNPSEVVFNGVMDIVIHTAVSQTLELVNDIATQPSGRITLHKEQILVEEVVGIKSAVVPVHSSLLLPTFKPGVQRILDYLVKPVGITSGLFNGRLAVKGMLEVALVYVGVDDEGRPTEIFVNEWNRETETAIPFEAYFDADIAGRVLAEPKIIAKNLVIENKTYRELRCQLELECIVKAMQIQTKEIVAGASSQTGELLDMEQHLLNIEEFVEAVEGVIDFEMEVDLPANTPNIERLLTYRGVLEELEVEVADHKLLVNGNLNLGLYYIAEGNDNQRLFQARWDKQSGNSLPITGYLEGTDLHPGSVLRSRVSLDSLKLELLAGRTVKLHGAIKPSVVIKKPRAISVVQNCAIVTPVDPANRPSILFYIVQAGDTLWKIARKYQTTMEAIARANQLSSSPYRVEPGQKLLIPKR